jgi:hypothetical protein
MKLYGDRLMDLDARVIRAAAEQLVATSRFFPTLAEIRAACEAVTKAEQPTALDVYGDTIRELSRALAARQVPQLDPVAREVVAAMGGAYTLVASDNGTADRARFLEAYNEKRRQREAVDAIVPAARALVGAPERREIAATPMPALPAHEEPTLTPAEAAELVREIRRRSPIGFRPAVEAVPAAKSEAVEPVPAADLRTCGDCSLGYPEDLPECPKCRIKRLLAEAEATAPVSLDDAEALDLLPRDPEVL